MTLWMDANRGIDEITREMFKTAKPEQLAEIRRASGQWWPVTAYAVPINQPLGPLVNVEEWEPISDALSTPSDEEPGGFGSMERARSLSSGLAEARSLRSSLNDPGTLAYEEARDETDNNMKAAFWARARPEASPTFSAPGPAVLPSTPAQAVGVGRAVSGSMESSALSTSALSQADIDRRIAVSRSTPKPDRPRSENVDDLFRASKQFLFGEYDDLNREMPDEESVRARALGRRWIVEATELLSLATGDPGPAQEAAMERVEDARSKLAAAAATSWFDEGDLGEARREVLDLSQNDAQALIAADIADVDMPEVISRARAIANLHVIVARKKNGNNLTLPEMLDNPALLTKHRNLTDTITANQMLTSELKKELPRSEAEDPTAGLPTAFTPSRKMSTINIVHRIVAIWRLMDETMPATHKAFPDIQRGLMKKLKKAGLPSQITVVTLRREAQEALEAAPAPGSVDWQYRWGVRGHWRTYHRGTEREYRIWIRDYVKGPDHAPLKISDKVYDLSR